MVSDAVTNREGDEMAKQSKAEQEFRAKYPFANLRPTGREFCPYAVYAGDYLCAEGATPREAFSLALAYERDRLITPDPEEQAGDYGNR
jgi:hypothetical protein